VSVFLLLGLLIYGPSLQNDFVNFDDGPLIYENALLPDTTLPSFGKIFLTYDPELYVPLTTLSYKINYLLRGLDPFGYHLGNLLLHTLNALLVVWFTYVMLRRPARSFETPSASLRAPQDDAGWSSRSMFVAIACGLLFLVHPLHTEAVAWASARKDLLSAFFFLGSLIAYVCHAERSSSPYPSSTSSLRSDSAQDDTAGAKTKHGFILSLTLFLLGLLSKITIVLLPFVLLLIDWYQGRRMDRKTFIEKIPFAVLSVLFLVIAFHGKVGRMSAIALWWEKFLLACKGMAFYLQKLLLPTELSVLYPFTDPIALTNPDLLLSVLVVIILSVAAFWSTRKTKAPLFALGFFLLTLLPSFASLTREHNAVIDFYFASDRYTYLPSIAFFFLVCLLLSSINWKKFSILQPSSASGGLRPASNYQFSIPSIVIGIIILTFGTLSHTQSMVWQNTNTLFKNVLTHYPNSSVAHAKIGDVLFEQGNAEDALEAYKNSVSIRPNALAYYKIGLLMLQVGNTDQAILALGMAIEASPNDTPSYVLLAQLLAREGKREEAVAILTRLFSQKFSLREGKEEARELLRELQGNP